jgi:DUF971 family protein
MSTNVQAKPTTIKLAGGNDTITIQWNDQHLSTYPYRYLRDKCPCATCTDVSRSHDRPPQAPPTSFPILGSKPLRPDRAELVGRYALQIYWSDGHSSGIYGFDYLRRLCRCKECAALNGA